MEEKIEEAKERCKKAVERIANLPATTNITDSSKRTLLKLAHSELHFLSHSPPPSPLPLSVNIGHLEAVVHVLQQPFVTGVSRVCKLVPLSSTNHKGQSLNSVYVDIVCTLNKKPVWVIVSDRNPKYVSWLGDCKSKGLKLKIEALLGAAAQSSETVKPCSVILFFSHGLDPFIFKKLTEEFGASQLRLEFCAFDFDFSEDVHGDWVNVIARPYDKACILEIKLDGASVLSLNSNSGFGDVHPSLLVHPPQQKGISKTKESLCTLISGMKPPKQGDSEVDHDNLINFDTTTLIAIVSGISNGCAEKLLTIPDIELRQRFKGNVDFVVAQVESEIQNPIHPELAAVITGKRGMICESVVSEFKELVTLCGGPNEKTRADEILQHLLVVPDNPSKRMMELPTTRKLALKNKIVFGTGDFWHAPTLTANMGFVRAVSQTGMSLSTIQHKPRALTGD